MNKTGIEWTELTWNPLRGCSRVSEGCRNCYAERVTARNLPGMAFPDGAFPAVQASGGQGSRWTGRVELIEEKLTEPLRRRKPSTIFVCSMSDLFHEKMSDEWIDRIFAVMAHCPQHRFLVLTKRAKAMQDYLAGTGLRYGEVPGYVVPMVWRWPLPNVGLGVSCEGQERADERIPDLLATPAAMSFVSLEPLLGAVDLFGMLGADAARTTALTGGAQWTCGLDWVIVGGESGPGARPMHPDWVRSIRDQCIAAGVPFLFKQWGEWAPDDGQTDARGRDPWPHVWLDPDGTQYNCFDIDRVRMRRVGKRAAGRLLDGKLWDQRPEGWR